MNLVTTPVSYLTRICQRYRHKKIRPSLFNILGVQNTAPKLSARSKVGAKWLSKVRKTGPMVTAVSTHQDSIASVSVTHLSPLDSELSFSNISRIEAVVDWELVRRKYRELHGDVKKISSVEAKMAKDDEQEPQLREDVLSRAGSQVALLAAVN